MLWRWILWNSAHQNALLALYLLNIHLKYTTPADKVNPSDRQTFQPRNESRLPTGGTPEPKPRSSMPSRLRTAPDASHQWQFDWHVKMRKLNMDCKNAAWRDWIRFLFISADGETWPVLKWFRQGIQAATSRDPPSWPVSSVSPVGAPLGRVSGCGTAVGPDSVDRIGSEGMLRLFPLEATLAASVQ